MLKDYYWNRGGENENIYADSIVNWRVESEKGIISILCPCSASMSMWEILSIQGNLFEDIERFDSIFEMIDRIVNVLT